MTTNTPRRTPAFSLIVSFIVLMIIGLALMPQLSVHLHPTRFVPTLHISFGWSNASPRLIEQEVTAPLEGLFNTIIGIKKIRSSSRRGSGSISLEFDDKADMDNKRFEIAAKIREAYPGLPDGVSYPNISYYSQDTEEPILLSYTLNAPASPRLIQEYAEDHIVPKLSHIEGLYRVRVSGATPMEWELTYDQEQLWSLGINHLQILSALQGYFQNEVIGMGFDLKDGDELTAPKPIILKSLPNEENSWLDIPVTSVNGRIVRIKDLCRVLRKEQEPNSYYRINGNNTINMRCTAEPGANSLKVAAALKEEMKKLEANFPAGFFILMTNDSTELMKDELDKIYYRTLFSFTILLLFVLLISRQFRYMLIIFISLIANLLTAFILYYLLKVQINLYSLAGITVSLGLIIDNTIVMLDHIRTKKNRRVFLATLAATLTTIGALSVIRFFGDVLKTELVDFSMVLIINLFVSLMVALFLVPSLLEKIPLKPKNGKKSRRRKIHVIRFTNFYARSIAFAQRFRWAYIILAILIFGLPIFKMPTRMEGEEWYHKLYQKTLASDLYVQKLKPVLDKALGGTLRLFSTQVANRYRYRYPERTRIDINASLPEGAVLQQMNDLMIEVERYLTQYEQVDQYITNVSDARHGHLTVTFKPEYELGAFAYILYSQLNDLANKLGGADWNISGVGQYFNNSVSEQVGSQRIALYGYNFEELIGFAEWTLHEAMLHQRVQKGSIISKVTWRRDPLYEYVLRMDPEVMETYGIGTGQIMSQLRGFSINHTPNGQVFIDGNLEPVRLQSKQSREFDVWMMSQTPVQQKSSVVKLANLGEVKREAKNRSIEKENQQYVLIVEYEFIGAYKLAQLHQERLILRVKDHLPIGYSAERMGYNYYRPKAKQQFLLIILVIAIIYLICSILLESLKQPLAVVLIIPVSFVGVFLTFFLFDFSFDQGCFASFLLLSGLVVNAALYILNDYNNLEKAGRYKKDHIRLYLKAFNGKIIPIFLTVMSTVLGLVPFLSGGEDNTFWFSLAVGTMGGLLFSILALIIFLPAFMKLK
ncbi:MAG: efflux RND transporter permease subunit, partial [Bacteroidales bacterium]|nr:efflux RND transporter permease subunit [Bacteroidales bacterium]